MNIIFSKYFIKYYLVRTMLPYSFQPFLTEPSCIINIFILYIPIIEVHVFILSLTPDGGYMDHPRLRPQRGFHGE